MQSVLEFDPNDVDQFVRCAHHEAFARWRREDPVRWHDHPLGGGFWNLTKYHDLIAVSRDTATFSSEHQIILDNRTPAEGVPIETYGSSVARARDRTMIETDPPRHARMRALINKGFTPKGVSRLEEPMRRIANRIVDRALALEDCDFVNDIARPLPLAIMGEMLGAPESEWPALCELANVALAPDDPEPAPGSTRESAQAHSARVQSMFAEIAADRRVHPRERDLPSQLVRGLAQDEGLSENEVQLFFVLLVIAGIETTRNATTGGMLALIERPEQLARLQSDRSLLPTAVEEMLRWASPGMHFMRVATTDTELRGRTIRRGDRVVMWYVSANRDEEIFGPDSMRFRIDRQPNEHLAFGIGEHFCLGANLARLELRVLFEALMARTRSWELAGPVERLRSNFIAGIKRMPVRLRPA